MIPTLPYHRFLPGYLATNLCESALVKDSRANQLFFNLVKKVPNKPGCLSAGNQLPDLIGARFKPRSQVFVGGERVYIK